MLVDGIIEVLRNTNDDIHITHYNDIIMSAIASQITRLTIVYSTVNSGTDEREY